MCDVAVQNLDRNKQRIGGNRGLRLPPLNYRKNRQKARCYTKLQE